MNTGLISWIISSIAPHFRSPHGGIQAWAAMKFMQVSNTASIQEGIRRLDLKESDTFVELGAAHGTGLKAIANSGVIPKRVVCVEISPNFLSELEKVKQNLPPNFPVGLHDADAKDMSSFLNDESVDKMFAMNVVYFLDPLSIYLQEIHRVLKPGGIVVFGCKFEALPQDSKEFVNIKEAAIVESMKEAGFKVTSTKVKVDGGEDFKKNYQELKGTK
jgi:ubiquinone/menaquinone biosynthesis C-methylase UbiE